MIIFSKIPRRIFIACFLFAGMSFAIHAKAATPQAGLFNAAGTRLASFPEVAAGSSVAVGDINSDGTDEVVFGSPPGARSAITTYGQDGTLIKTFYPYQASMTDGIQVAVGDVTGTGVPEVVTVPRKGAYCKVLRFNASGKQLGTAFYALGKPLRTGCTLALGDVDGNGSKDIIAGIGPGDNPDVNVFTAAGIKLGTIHAYEPTFHGGVNVASFDYDGDGKDDIIVAPYTNRISAIKVKSFPDGKILSSFVAYGNFRGGVMLSANTSNGGRRILMGAGNSGGPHVRQINALTHAIDGVDVMPLDKIWRGGVTVAFVSYTDITNFIAVPGATSLSFADLINLGAATQTVFTGNSNFSYEKRSVTATSGIFTAHIVRVNLKNPKLKITSLSAGSESNCFNLPCKVKPLASYLSQAKGTIAINGSYFCPSDYASCRGIAGSYYWMWYNTLTGKFTNAHHNQFNNGPDIVFDTQNHFYYYKPAKDWHSIATFESVTGKKFRAQISNGPDLVFESRVVVSAAELDTKQLTVHSNRSGIGFRGDDMYLVIANGATVIDLGNIMKALGMEYAMNLDGGGSSSLMYDGAYKVGPGRQLPNALVIGEI